MCRLKNLHTATEIKGSLNKDNGNLNKNVTTKYRYRKYFSIIPSCSDDHFVQTGELSCNWMGTNGNSDVKVKIGNELFLFVVATSCCHQNPTFGDFTLVFCGVR